MDSRASKPALIAPRISVLMPVRNAVHTLDEALSSIRSQTLRDFEIIAVDDGSDDGSWEKLAAYAASENRFRLLRSPARGLVPALNVGMAAARSELIARMDADDRMHSQRLARQYEHMRRHARTDVLGSRVCGFPGETLTDGFREYLDWQNSCISPRSIAQDIYLESPLAHPSVMFRKRAVQDLGGYREGMFPEDYDLWFRLLLAGKILAKLPQTLLDWRDDPQRTSRRDPRCSREAFDRLRAHYLAQDPRLKRNRGKLVIWGAGRRTRRRTRHLMAQGFRPIAWIDIDPHKIGNRLDGVPVVEPEWLAQPDRPFVLSYVAAHGARRLIERALEDLGYMKGENYLNVG